MNWRERYEREGRELLRLIRKLEDECVPGYEGLTSSGLFRDLCRDPIITSRDDWDFRVQSLAYFTRGYLELHKLGHQGLMDATTGIFEAVGTSLLESRYWGLQREFRCSKFVAAALLRDFDRTLKGGSLALLWELSRFPNSQAARILQDHGVDTAGWTSPEMSTGKNEPHLGSLFACAALEAGPRLLGTGDLLLAMLSDSPTEGCSFLRGHNPEVESVKSLLSTLEPEEMELENCTWLIPTTENPSSELSPMEEYLLAGWCLTLAVCRCPAEEIQALLDEELLASILDDEGDLFRSVRLAWLVRNTLLEIPDHEKLERAMMSVVECWRDAVLPEVSLSMSLAGHLEWVRQTGSLSLLRAFLRDRRCGAYHALLEQGIDVDKLAAALSRLSDCGHDHMELFLALAKACDRPPRFDQKTINTVDVLIAMLESAETTRAGEVLRKLQIDTLKLRVWADKPRVDD